MTTHIQNSRIAFLDIAKGLGIILVMLGHSALDISHQIPEIRPFIYSFHMPLFFIVYGMATHSKAISGKDKWIEFFRKRFYRLIVPYFIWAFIYCRYSDRAFIKICYASRYALESIHSLTSLWFLPVMFLSVIAFEIILSAIESFSPRKKTLTKAGLAGICFAVAAFLPKYLPIGYPWGCNIAVTGLMFMLVGTLIRTPLFKFLKQQEEKTGSLQGAIPFVISLIFLILTFSYKLNPIQSKFFSGPVVNMCAAEFGNYPLFVFTALAGSFSILFLSRFIEQAFSKTWLYKLLVFMGVNSLGLYILHKFPLRVCCSKVHALIHSFDLPYLADISLSLLIGNGVTLLIISVLAILINKHLPLLFGNEPTRKL